MTFAPTTIKELAAYWVGQGGVNSGIVGDAAHQARASYHNGQDVIEKYGRTAANDYTIRLPRDREPHLTNAAAALDLGRLNGSLAELQAFSRDLVARTRADPVGYRAIRDIIYSPDGKVVRRWDNETKQLNVGGTGTGQGDDSHLWHTHISFYRDSEFVAKVALFRPYFEEGYMPIETTSKLPKVATWKLGLKFYDLNGAETATATADSTTPRPASPEILIAGKPHRLVTIHRNVGPLAGKDQLVAVLVADASGTTPLLTLADPPAAITKAELDAAVLAAKRAQYDADKAAANADPVNLGTRP